MPLLMPLPPPHGEPADCRSAPPEHRRAVLYVEDSEVNSLLMSALFQRRADLQLVLARSGRQALRLARSLRPSLLLLDFHLPDCEGNQLLAHLRRIPACREAPAVLVSGDGRLELPDGGFAERWSKPLDFAHAMHRVDVLLATPPLQQA